jgi:cell division protein FtsB
MAKRDIARRFFTRHIGRSPVARASFEIPRWLLVAAMVYLVYALGISNNSARRILELKHEIGSNQAEATRMRKEADEINGRLSDPEKRRFHAESVARTELGWAASDELVYRFRDDGTVADSTR